MLLLSTRSLAWYGLDTIFSLTKSALYDGIDLNIDFSLFDTINAKYLDSLIVRHELPILSITAPERRMTKKQVEEIVKLADNLGVKIVNLTPPHRSDREKDWFSDWLRVLMSKHPNITINIINAPPKTWLFVIAEYADARPETIKKITEHTSLSIANVDPGSGVDLMKTFTLLGNTIDLVYLGDKTEEDDKLFPWEGSMPLESLLIRMKEAGYTGLFSLDINPKMLLAGDDEKVRKKLEEAKEFLYKYFN